MKKSSLLLVLAFCFALVFLLNSGDVGAQLENSPWPMIHGNLKHTGLSPYDTSHVDGTVKWTFETGAGIESSPTIGPDGTIYVGSHDCKLYALNPDGTLKWKFNAGEPIYIGGWDVWKGIPSAPTIDENGTIYFIAPPTYLFALNSDGTEKWRYPVYASAHIACSPVIVPDGTIYVGSESFPHEEGVEQEFGARVYALNSDGTLKWRYDTDGSCLGNPIAVAGDGTLYVTGSAFLEEEEEELFRNAVYAFNPDGSIKWKLKIERVEGPPTIAEDGTIYVGTKNGKLYALNPDGSQKWVFQADNGISVMAALGKDGKIYFGSWDRNFYALNPEGEELWRFETPPAFEALSSSAAIGADGTIYFGHNIGNFYALNPDGTEKWHLFNIGPVISSPAIGADGTVYVGSLDNKLYAFGGPTADGGVNGGENENIPGEVAPGEGMLIVYMAVAAVIVGLVSAVFLLKRR